MEVQGAGALVAGGPRASARRRREPWRRPARRSTIADRDAERGEALATEIGASFAAADVTDPAAVQAAVEQAAGAEGGLRISVCCAGIGWVDKLARTRARTTSTASPRSSGST